MEEKEMTGGQVSGADAMEKDNQLGQEKTYTQAEFDKALLAETDKRVNQALENKKAEWEKDYSERLKAEKDEAARIAKMSADERAQAEFDKRVKDFEDREAKHMPHGRKTRTHGRKCVPLTAIGTNTVTAKKTSTNVK